MRNALAWVVVLAGFRPTPAEELDGVIESHRQLHGAKDMGAAQVVEPTTTVEEIEAALKECGVDKAKLIAKTNGAEIADLDQENREKALAWIKKQKAKAA
jgi:hypothetical protein